MNGQEVCPCRGVPEESRHGGERIAEIVGRHGEIDREGERNPQGNLRHVRCFRRRMLLGGYDTGFEVFCARWGSGKVRKDTSQYTRILI